MLLLAKRLDAGLTQQELGKLAELPKSFVSKVERGQGYPTPAQRLALCVAAGITVTELSDMCISGGMSDEADVDGLEAVDHTKPLKVPLLALVKP